MGSLPGGAQTNTACMKQDFPQQACKVFTGLWLAGGYVQCRSGGHELWNRCSEECHLASLCGLFLT